MQLITTNQLQALNNSTDEHTFPDFLFSYSDTSELNPWTSRTHLSEADLRVPPESPGNSWRRSNYMQDFLSSYHKKQRRRGAYLPQCCIVRAIQSGLRLAISTKQSLQVFMGLGNAAGWVSLCSQKKKSVRSPCGLRWHDKRTSHKLGRFLLMNMKFLDFILQIRLLSTHEVYTMG